jgi:hypothetical protein
MGRACSTKGTYDKFTVQRLLVDVDKPEGKRSLGRHKLSCKDNIKMGFSDRV